MRRASFPLISITIGILLALLTMELVLRFLPVNEGARPEAVDQEHPVRSLEPNRTFVWSADWNFAIVNRVRTNNLGFVNDQDYVTDPPSPLLALIGDSYVEALMVPFRDSVAGRLSTRSAPAERVYSFGTSSSALSNYLAYAEYASRGFHPQAMVFVIIGNDFDESLLKYKTEPGHSFAKDAKGDLALRRIDYHPSLWRRIIRSSALVRYVTLNTDLLNFMLKWQHLPFGRPSNTLAFVGNTGAQANPARMADAQRAIDTFLASVTKAAGLPPPPHPLRSGRHAPAHLRRQVVATRCRLLFRSRATVFHEAGSPRRIRSPRPPTPLRRAFFPTPPPVRFATDNHWNSLGHEVVEEAIAQSTLYGWFRNLISEGS